MTLYLMVNCQIMLLRNIDVSMGLVNGNRGAVYSIIEENGFVKILNNLMIMLILFLK